MNNLVCFQVLQTYENLNCKPANEFLIEAIVIVTNYQLVEIVTQKLEDNTDVLPKHNEIFDSHYIWLLFIVFLLYVA